MNPMVSIDTNILIRFLTGDDKKQAVKAKKLFSEENIYITKTVILETEWVLRYAYEFSEDAIASAYTKLLGQKTVIIEDSYHIAQAVSLLNKGMEFADALHLVCSQNYPFVTFDKKLANKAKASGFEAVQLLW